MKLEPEFEVVEPLIDVDDPTCDFGTMLQDVKLPDELVHEEVEGEAKSRYKKFIDFPVEITAEVEVIKKNEQVVDMDAGDEEEDVEPADDEGEEVDESDHEEEEDDDDEDAESE